MTAKNFINTGKRAFLFTDGAAIDSEGRIVSIDRKGRHTSSFPGFIVTSGPVNWLDMFEDLMVSDFRSIDDLAENGRARFLDDIEPWIVAKAGAKIDYQALVIGWSERAKLVRTVAFWSSLDVGFRTDDWWWMSPFPPEESARAFLRAGRSPDFDPIRDGLPLIEAQRRKAMSADDWAAGQHFVGGHVELTEISEAGISQRIIHEWPEDQIGERIRPTPPIDFAANPTVVPIAGMNRAERRRLAKMQRRVA